MEARFEGERFYNLNSMDLRALGKRSPEWDLNDWKWDGDLFIARQLNSGTSETIGRQFFPLGSLAATARNLSNSSSSCSDEGNIEIIERGRSEMDRKRRVVVVEDENVRDDAGSLSLKLGGHGYPSSERERLNWEASCSKKTKSSGIASNRAVCQVENCGADLSKVKDYHRRHKVCEMHSKASNALVGGILQRFCQQCSRFHVLQEFDEGKRSCRRRLAGHNKRRRKTNPDAGGNRMNDDQMSSYLLISLLKILSNMHSNTTDHASTQDLLSHILKSLACQNGQDGGRNISGLLQRSQGSPEVGPSALLTNREAPHEALKSLVAPMLLQQEAYIGGVRGVDARDGSARQVKMNDFDLNDIYIDSDDSTEDVERSPPMNPATSSLDNPPRMQQDSYQFSPPQTSRNSDSASDQSPSSSGGDAQSRTDRIVFKLFGKEPNDFPVGLRAQILDWLAHSPTDIESYIRPGCIILTIYLRQAEASWEELCGDLGFFLSKLLDISDDTFWSAGWVYVRVQNQIAFACNGQVVLDASLPLRCSNHSRITSVKPIAVASTEKTQFKVRGVNLNRPGTRLLCAIEGKYLIQQADHEVMDGDDELNEQEQNQCVSFCGDIPMKFGRGFIEIEDQGLSSSFFPFIVAEDDVCSEIRMLESLLEFAETGASKQAMDFIHEIGWLFHKIQHKSNPSMDPFPMRRFKWLIEFSIDREWCAVIRKLLNILFEGAVDSGDHSSVDLAVSDLCLLHRAVRKNSKPVVEMLLRYVPEPKTPSSDKFLFRPDVMGPAGLTPLHIAAGKDGSEDVLEALTEDPGMVGIEAWKNARDSTGFAPEDYARLRGHYSYIHLVQRKSKKSVSEDQVVINIPTPVPDPLTDHNLKQNTSSTTTTSIFEINHTHHTACKLCNHKKSFGGYSTGITTRRSMAYRPAMLSMVAVAAVCVCVALLFKSCPEVLYVFRPFRWESLDYGSG